MSSGTLRVVKQGLLGCGYTEETLQENYPLGTWDGEEASVPLAGFAHRPFDARSACIGVAKSNGHPENVVKQLRILGAPVIFLDDAKNLQWWKQIGDSPELKERIPHDNLETFFDAQRTALQPRRVYRAKTLGRLEHSEQLDFVDVGLLPLLENDAGERDALVE